jgi:UDP-glucose 4-epimerase
MRDLLLADLRKHFFSRNVLITGGLGFIGSNLAISLVELGANVTIVDGMIQGYGGNLYNVNPIKEKICVNYCDICDVCAMNHIVRDQDYIFHLAGQVSHILSLSDPFPDIEFNIKGTTILMEACKKFNPSTKIIYTGTRGQYGPATTLPVNEDAPTNPRGIYEISNLTAEKIIKIYNDIHQVKSVLLRLTNIYGPRAQMKHSQYGVVNWFIRLALDNSVIPVFGDGRILRDFLYIDDCVEGLLMCAVNDSAIGEIFNLGVDKPNNFVELADKIVTIAGTGRWEFSPFSAERKAQEPGDFYSDISKITKTVGWEPKTSLEDGLKITIDYYRCNKSRYW